MFKLFRRIRNRRRETTTHWTETVPPAAWLRLM